MDSPPAQRKIVRSYSVSNWKPPSPGQGSTWKFWRRFSFRSRSHEGKIKKDSSHTGISKKDISEPTGFEDSVNSISPHSLCLPDVVAERPANLPVFNANAVPPPKPPRLFLFKSLSNTSIKSSSEENVSESSKAKLRDSPTTNSNSGERNINDDNNENNNNNNNSDDPKNFLTNSWLLDSADFTRLKDSFKNNSISTLNNYNFNNNNKNNNKNSDTVKGNKQHQLCSLSNVNEEEEEEETITKEHTDNNNLHTAPSVDSVVGKDDEDSKSLLSCMMSNAFSKSNDNVFDMSIDSMPHRNNSQTVTSSLLLSSTSSSQRSASPSSASKNLNISVISNTSSNNSEHSPAGLSKPKIVTPEFSVRRWRKQRRKLSTCNDLISRQWRIMASVLDLMCQRLDPYPLLDPLKRAGILTNVHLQSFLSQHNRRSICEGLVDIIGNGTAKSLSVFCAAVAACPGNCTEMLELLQVMREIDRIIYDIPETKDGSSNESTNGDETSTEDNASTASTKDKSVTFEVGCLTTDYHLKPLAEADKTKRGSGININGGNLNNNNWSKTCSRNSSFYSLLEANTGSTMTLNSSSFGGNNGLTGDSDPVTYSGLVMMSVNVIGHSLQGERSKALVEVINNHNCISELHLGNTQLNGEEIASLTQALTEKKSAIHTLDLRLNTIDLVGAKAISDYLIETRFLRELNLSSTELNSEGFCKIISAISGSKSLIEFDGSFLDISDECSSSLRDMLRINTTLQKLRLRGNNISSLGCQAFCKGLVKNIALSVLDLSRNPIGDGGVEALAQNLPDTYVTELYIDGCGITSKGGQSLAEIISRCKKLKQIDVSTNQLEDAGLFKLAPALEHTSSLVTLCLNMCSITNDGFAKLLDVLEKNTSIEVLKLCFNKLGEEPMNSVASSDKLRHRLRIISSSKPKLKITTWGNKFDES